MRGLHDALYGKTQAKMQLARVSAR